MKYPTIIALFFIVLSCKKSAPEEILEQPTAIEIAATNTVKTASLGQNITSTVTLAIPSITGDVTFLGFNVVETSTKVFSVKVKEIYKPWPNGIALPMYQSFDTTLNIQTKLAGQHVLNFYNGTQLLKSDTVRVF